MSQQPDTVLNGSSSESNVPLKDAQAVQEMTTNQQQFIAAGIQRPPLPRLDSRTSFPIRPGFAPVNQQQGAPFRPPQIRQQPPPPGQQQQQFIQRGVPGGPRPPGQYPANQSIRPHPNFRPPTPFPRPPQQGVPGGRPPGIFQQRSVPNFGQQLQLLQQQQQQQRQRFSIDGGTRSFTLDSADVDVKTNEDINNVIKNQSISSNISDNQNDDERRRSICSLDDKRSVSGSVENLDKRSENDYPSRPESRANTRMDRILENDNATRSDSKTDTLPDIKTPTLVAKLPSHVEDIQKTDTPIKIETDNRALETIKKEEITDNVKSKTINFDTKNLELKDLPKTKTEGDNDSGVDESTQGNDHSSDHNSPRKSSTKLPSRTSSTTPTKNRSLSRGSKSPSLKSPDSNASTPGATEKKKLPMNKIQVGSAPSPNLKEVKSKIGSLQNATYKPGGGNVKIESKKIDFKNAAPRIEAKNEKYTPKGGDKKIQQQKLQWNAKSKIGSLENATHKPKGGDKKIETIKLDFKEKAKPKVGSKDNIKHVPGGGDVKSDDEDNDKKGIENKKIELNVQSKVGSLDNVKHKPGGGEKKIFDDKEYIKQRSHTSTENHSLSGSQNSLPSQPEVRGPVADENLNQEH